MKDAEIQTPLVPHSTIPSVKQVTVTPFIFKKDSTQINQSQPSHKTISQSLGLVCFSQMEPFHQNIYKPFAGNVTFTVIGYDPYQYDSFITVIGINVHLENLQFYGYRGSNSISLIFIALSEKNTDQSAAIYYNFTDISYLSGFANVISTSASPETNYFGTIFLNNFLLADSLVRYAVNSFLEVDANALTIKNSTTQFYSFLQITVVQQVIPVSMYRVFFKIL